MSRRNITNEEKQTIAALTANNQSVNAIHTATGLHSTTILKVLQEPQTQEMIVTAGKLLSGKMLERADQIVNSISNEDVFKASLRDKTVSAGVLMDKARQAYGLDKTSVIVTDGLTFSALMASLVVEPMRPGRFQQIDCTETDPE